MQFQFFLQCYFCFTLKLNFSYQYCIFSMYIKWIVILMMKNYMIDIPLWKWERNPFKSYYPHHLMTQKTKDSVSFHLTIRSNHKNIYNLSLCSPKYVFKIEWIPGWLLSCDFVFQTKIFIHLHILFVIH